MKRFLTALLFASSTLFATPVLAQPAIDHLEPPFWWAGMHNPKLQLMVHGKGIGALAPTLSYPGVRIASVTRVANNNYLFIDLHLAPDARPGTFEIRFGKSLSYRYQLLAREPGSAERQGFSSKDAIYQVMPDRFANGNPANDSVKGLAEQANRALPGGRHGGDIQGIIDHLCYIAGMGFTQLWPTPLVENDMPAYSYHGYAATDHYQVDARYGSNADYLRLSDQARKQGIGIIQDVVLSHIGSSHWWMKDMPTPDWVNHPGQFTPTRHHRVAVQDPYGSREDSQNFTTGWFGKGMPDLNQTNPMVATYLIQNNIWWIEYARLSGLRIDTYGYSDGAFLTEFTRRVMAEYPNLNMVGEEWHKSPAVVSHWQKGKVNFDGYTSYLPSLMDFPLSEAMRSALASKEPDAGFTDVYETFSQDYLYPNPGNLVLFDGNHDLSRIYSVVGEDMGLYKIAIAWLMTMPRIPQFYNGSEVLMTSDTGARNDASYRRDIPGGWAGDQASVFTGAGLTAPQREAQQFVRKLVNWRKGADVIHRGKTMHFGAEDGTYVYFRYDASHTVMVAMNRAAAPVTLQTARFAEVLKGASTGVDVISGQRVALDGAFTVPAHGVFVLELQ
ncbi:MAG TPA: glycoside hydrolase family 13 protein [Telluria sp.]|nr:glycoside hydrolase family 13 protein [Telluria sp.]